MSAFGGIVKFVGAKFAEAALSSAGTQIGEAIGKRIGAKIYTPPPEAKEEAKP